MDAPKFAAPCMRVASQALRVPSQSQVSRKDSATTHARKGEEWLSVRRHAGDEYSGNWGPWPSAPTREDDRRRGSTGAPRGKTTHPGLEPTQRGNRGSTHWRHRCRLPTARLCVNRVQEGTALLLAEGSGGATACKLDQLAGSRARIRMP